MSIVNGQGGIMGKWSRKYELLMEEELNTEMMKVILGKPHAHVKNLRIEIITNLALTGIKLADNYLIPTEIFLKHIGRDMKYYEQKMKQESILNKYRKENRDE